MILDCHPEGARFARLKDLTDPSESPVPSTGTNSRLGSLSFPHEKDGPRRDSRLGCPALSAVEGCGGQAVSGRRFRFLNCHPEEGAFCPTKDPSEPRDRVAFLQRIKIARLARIHIIEFVQAPRSPAVLAQARCSVQTPIETVPNPTFVQETALAPRSKWVFVFGVGRIVVATSGQSTLRALQSRTNKHRTLDNCIESPGKVVRIRLQQIPNGSKEEGPSHEIRRRILAQDY